MSTFQKDLYRGKVLFITGGRSGIGYTTTQALMNHGADAVIVGRDAKGLAESAAKLSKETGRKCVAAAGDVRSPDQMKEAVEVAKKEFGKIDFVICGAAGNFLAPISGLSERAFKTVIEIDLLGTFNTVKATLPLIRESKGSYIHISATLQYRGTPFQPHLSAAKAGVDALSNVLAVEEGPRGVRSNCVAPGPIGDTPGMDRLTPKSGKGNLEEIIPLGRQGSRGDIADACLFLFSPAASWITGTIMVVDGGDQHTRNSYLPYPEAVLNSEKAQAMIKARL